VDTKFLSPLLPKPDAPCVHIPRTRRSARTARSRHDVAWTTDCRDHVSVLEPQRALKKSETRLGTRTL
jgi:hypothetical protein